jgi:hypothetical protein
MKLWEDHDLQQLVFRCWQIFPSSQIEHQRHFTVQAVKDRNFVSEQDKNPHEVEALKTNQNKHSELNQTFISSYIHVFFKDNSIWNWTQLNLLFWTFFSINHEFVKNCVSGSFLVLWVGSSLNHDCKTSNPGMRAFNMVKQGSYYWDHLCPNWDPYELDLKGIVEKQEQPLKTRWPSILAS